MEYSSVISFLLFPSHESNLIFILFNFQFLYSSDPSIPFPPRELGPAVGKKLVNGYSRRWICGM